MRTETGAISLTEPGHIGSLSGQTATVSAPCLTTTQSITRLSVFAALASAGLIWDLFSKWYVFNQLGALQRRHIWTGSLLGIPTEFQLATTFNHGALWGIGQGRTWLFAALSLVALVVIAYFIWNRQAISSWFLTIATGLLLAGTLGNLFDRLGLHGWKENGAPVYAVRDFLDFVFFNGAFEWATFNFADTYLVTGAIMLVVQSMFTPASDQQA